MSIEVASHVIEQIEQEARAAIPCECCGILLGEDMRIAQAVPASNVHPSPETHFEIDPQALIDVHRAAREGGPQVLGYYHSHPSGPAKPSAADRASASGDGRIWVIVGQEGFSFWKDAPGGFTVLSFDLFHA